MQDNFGEMIVPTEEVVEMKGGQKRKSERKFFPGYVLVQMELERRFLALSKGNATGTGFYRWKSRQAGAYY